MPAYARRQIVAEGEVGIYHCLARCVRRAFLCGRDPLTGHDYEHRKEWVRRRLEFLAGIFAIDVCGYAAMSNHLHVVLRQRPDLADRWSDEDLARRWWRLCPRRRLPDGSPAEPTPSELAALTADARLAQWRQRLAHVSWFMRALCEPIARRANKEDQCTGRFWEGRFRSQALLDEAAVLACSVYVDLNPIRAGLAETPETSAYTSVCDRIAGLNDHNSVRNNVRTNVYNTGRHERGRRGAGRGAGRDPRHEAQLDERLGARHDARRKVRPDARLDARHPQSGATLDSRLDASRLADWLCPVNEAGDEPRPNPRAATRRGKSRRHARAGSRAGAGAAARASAAAGVAARAGAAAAGVAMAEVSRRASEKGFLPLALESYLELVDWTGRQVRRDKRGAIPGHLAPILKRLCLNGETWVETVQHFGRWFRRAAGRATSLAERAGRSGQQWFHGVGPARLAFT